jgi:hypothetical protein
MSSDSKRLTGEPTSQSAMADLYLAIRSDHRGIVKIGRSNDPYRRCDTLATSHCFRVKPVVVYPGAGCHEGAVLSVLDSKRVEGGPGREWFAVTLQQASNAVHQCLPQDFGSSRPDGLESKAWRAVRFIERLAPVIGPKHATEQADIDALAEKLYGNQWQGVLHAVGLVRHRCKVAGVNRYFYQLQLPEWPRASYVAINDDEPNEETRAVERVDRPESLLLERLTPVAGPIQATEQAEIDALAEELFGNRWQGAVHTAGLERRRCRTRGVNRYFYLVQFPGCPEKSYVAIKEDSSD